MTNYTRKWANPSGTRTYNSWKGLKDRCYNPKHISYPNYGGRGIGVCERWSSYDNFFEDMGERPPNTSLDRIDNNGDYEPGNCRWASNLDQHNNKRNNVKVTYMGETRTLSQWATALGITKNAVYLRVTHYKMPTEKAISTSRTNAWQHGTLWGYRTHKCRCEKCYAAHSEYKKRLYAAKKSRSI